MLYLEPFSFFLVLNLRDEPRLPMGSLAGEPPLRLLRMDPGEDGRVRTGSPQRTFSAVFPARTRRRLRSSPRQMIPRISIGFSDFSMGLPPRQGRRCGLQGAPPNESVPCLAWHSASAAARGRIPDQGSWALASDIRNSAWVFRRGGAAAAGCGARRPPHSCHRWFSALHALCATPTPPRLLDRPGACRIDD